MKPELEMPKNTECQEQISHNSVPEAFRSLPWSLKGRIVFVCFHENPYKNNNIPLDVAMCDAKYTKFFNEPSRLISFQYPTPSEVNFYQYPRQLCPPPLAIMSDNPLTGSEATFANFVRGNTARLAVWVLILGLDSHVRIVPDPHPSLASPPYISATWSSHQKLASYTLYSVHYSKHSLPMLLHQKE